MKTPYTSIIPVLLIQACALTHQEVELNPEVTVEKANVAQGAKIFLNTVDERTSSSVGARGIYGSAEIVAKSDVVEMIVHNTISDALQSKGFQVLNQKEASPIELRVEILTIELRYSSDILTWKLIAESVIKGICNIEMVSHYDDIYHGESTENVFLVQFAKENEIHLNKALSESIQKLIQDNELITCLQNSKKN